VDHFEAMMKTAELTREFDRMMEKKQQFLDMVDRMANLRASAHVTATSARNAAHLLGMALAQARRVSYDKYENDMPAAATELLDEFFP
jgi:hypothetical protein